MADPSETTQVSQGAALEQASGAETGSKELLAEVRELSVRVSGLQTELRTLRAEMQSLPAARAGAAGWEDRAVAGWVRSLDNPPARRPAAVPRLALEVIFLVGVAVACAIAELDARVIGAVMAGAWVVVALTEWTAARAARRQVETAYVPLAEPGSGIVPVDGSWFEPPVDRTMLGAAETAESTLTKLPPLASD